MYNKVEANDVTRGRKKDHWPAPTGMMNEASATRLSKYAHSHRIHHLKTYILMLSSNHSSASSPSKPASVHDTTEAGPSVQSQRPRISSLSSASSSAPRKGKDRAAVPDGDDGDSELSGTESEEEDSEEEDDDDEEEEEKEEDQRSERSGHESENKDKSSINENPSEHGDEQVEDEEEEEDSEESSDEEEEEP